jgi:iron complex outermembrane receptor protein
MARHMWLAGTALAGVCAAALSTAAMAAEPAATGAGTVDVAQAAPSLRFDIAAQDLNAAVLDYAQRAGVQVFYDAARLRGLRSQAVTGDHTPSEALDILLAGTGVSYRFTGPAAVTLERMTSEGPTTLPPVVVEGAASRESAYGPVTGYVATQSATGSKTDTPIREIPQTVNVVTADQMKAQRAQNIGQALRYTPGVMAETFGAASKFDIYTQIRGFRPNFYLDGTRLPNGSTNTGFSSSVVEPYGLERLEVLKGPASGVYGQSSPGGLINMVSKRPTDEPLHEVQLQTGSFERYQGAFDLGGPVDQAGNVTYRLTGLLRESDTQVDFIEDNRAYIAPALSMKLSDDTKLTLLGNYQSEWGGETLFNYVPRVGSLDGNPNGRLPRDRYYGDPDYDHLNREQYGIGYLLEHKLNDAVTLRQNLRYNHVEFDAKALTLTGVQTLTTANRSATRTEAQADSISIDNNAEVKFASGDIQHTALVGVDLRRERNDFKFGRTLAPAVNIYNPVYGVPINDPGYNIQQLNGSENQLGGYLQDQAKLDKWVFTLGGRFDYAGSDSYNRNNGAVTDQDDTALTGRVGVNYLFDNGMTPYVSYSTSFQPLPGAAFDGSAFNPSTGQEYEVGVKYQPPGRQSLYTMALFDLRQQDKTTADAAHPFFMQQVGEVHVQGVELEAKTQLTTSFSLTAGYSYLQHEITESATPAEIGRPLNDTPKHQASLWGDYRFDRGELAGLGLGAGVRYTGETRDLTDSIKMRSYTLFDAAVYYDLGHVAPDMEGVTLSLNAQNLFDKYYIPACNTTSGCTIGAGRTILATVNYQW